MKKILPVVAAIFLGLGCRLALIFTSYGSDDVHIFQVFSSEVRHLGPLGIYRGPTAFPYNHPPLIGWFLDALQWLARHGIAFPIALRVPSALADVGSALLAYKIVSSNYGRKRGTWAAALIALNPISIFVSGFHGNVDPIAFFLALLAFFLLTRASLPFVAGLAFALALGTKLVPVVTLPVLLIEAHRKNCLIPLCVGFTIASGLIWVPAFATSANVWANVLGYSGGQGHLWPLIAVGLSAGAGTLATRQADAYTGAAVACLGFSLVSPAWAAQYTVWPVVFGVTAMQGAPALIHGTLGGLFLFESYTHWSGGFPWERAYTEPGLDTLGKVLLMTTRLAAVVWLVALGYRVASKRGTNPRSERPREGSAEAL